MKIYLVGGAVRDELLGLVPKERDWVVVGAAGDDMTARGFKPADAAFPVFLHPETGDEYALARIERKQGAGYRGFEIESGPDITLEQDLARRDLTINAMARDEDGGLIDPYRGQEDLDAGMLRHVTEAFVEDPVRLLRIARFAARFGPWGFRVAHRTWSLMKQMAASEDLHALNAERVWREMRKSLAEPQPWRFFETLHRCGALEVLMPSLHRAMGDPDSHGEPVDSRPVRWLKAAVEQGADEALRFALLFAAVTEDEAEALALAGSLRAERPYRDRLLRVVALKQELHGLDIDDPDEWVGLLEWLHVFRDGGQLAWLETAWTVMRPQAAEQMVARLRAVYEAASAVKPGELAVAGLKGAELGAELHRRRVEQASPLFGQGGG